MRAAWIVAALLLSPIAHAEETCKLALGRGWPPATENYGSAVERLFAVGSQPAWSFTLLPKVGAESGLLLIPAVEGRDWTLRHAVADERVHYWGATKLELRTNQEPELADVPIPAAVAIRFAQSWDRALSTVAPEGSTAPFSEKDSWLFTVGDRRVSGLEPTCELGELMRDQIELLIEASDEGDEKREKRWRQLGKSLDRMHKVLDAMSKRAAP
jgi:hypothetical protein